MRMFTNAYRLCNSNLPRRYSCVSVNMLLVDIFYIIETLSALPSPHLLRLGRVFDRALVTCCKCFAVNVHSSSFILPLTPSSAAQSIVALIRITVKAVSRSEAPFVHF